MIIKCFECVDHLGFHLDSVFTNCFTSVLDDSNDLQFFMMTGALFQGLAPSHTQVFVER